MFSLNTVAFLIFDYRFIAINALIYNLIATEIVNVNAQIVITANGIPEFYNSATVQMARTTAKILRQMGEMRRDADEIYLSRGQPPTTTSNDQAELAFFGQKHRNEIGCAEDGEIGDNNNWSNNNIELDFALAKRITITNISLPVVAQTKDDVVVVAIPFHMMTDNCISILQTINERVDNFQNDKKQIASATVSITTTEITKQNVNAMTGIVTTARLTPTTNKTIETKTAILEQSTLKVNVITAIKSAATQFTTIALMSTSTSSSASASILETKMGITTTTNTYGTRTTPTIFNASITMSKMPAMAAANALKKRIVTTKTQTRRAPYALHRWPTLHGHDLLSSTNGMPNCRVTPDCTNIEKCPDATIKKSISRQTSALESSSPLSSPPTSILNGKMELATIITIKSNQKSWSTTHVKISDGRKRVKVMATIKTNEKFSPLNDNYNNFTVFHTNNKNNKKCLTTNHTSALHQTFHTLATPAAPPMSTTTTTAVVNSTSTTTNTIRRAASKSTAAIQSHWQRILSRRKRYLAFPEGSSFSVALCITVGIIGNPRYDYMSFGINWGVSYDLPNATWVLNQLHGLSRRPTPPAVLHRRNKRALYERIGEAVDNMGYNGRDCVLRALCESRQYFTRNKMGMIGEMLRVIFSLPKQRLYTRELHDNSDIAVYDHAYRKAHAMDCAAQYDCSFSLLELAFGKYAKPSTNYYNNKFGM